jgi:hypothetical protein
LDIHRPKAPIHGLRDFAKEVGIIVLGVLIALAGEQAVEALSWRHQVAEAKAVLKDELAVDAADFYERVAVEPCLTARLEIIEGILAKSGGAWRAGDLPVGHFRGVYGMPWRTYPGQAWQNALASGAAAHMSRQDLPTYEAIYNNVADLHQMNEQEVQARAQIDALDHDQALTDVSRDRYQKTLVDLRFYANASARIADESLQELKSMGLLPPPAALAETLGDTRKTYGTCVKTPTIG